MENFPSNGKKLKLSQFIKKWQTIKENCCPISLLPICGKILERPIYNKIFEFFTDSELISFNQSGFKLGCSCINQLFCTTQDIYQSFNDDFETTVFLDISKAFDKVWYEGLLYKLKQNGISPRIYSRIYSLFFLIYINDLPDDLTSNPKLFADATFLFSVVQNINSTKPI